MRASEILRNEHRVIEQVLNCLWAIADQAEQRQQLDEPSARQAIEFLRQYADQCHHGKEESHFFPALEARGLPRHGGPTGVMLAEHEMGRQHVRGMQAALDRSAVSEHGATTHFVAHARAFVELLRAHIQKEDHCLFGMADQTFSADEQQALLESFLLVESEHAKLGTQERCLQIAQELVSKYGSAIKSDCTFRSER
jgi:hemerythrin-like domain-containing protein